MKKICTVICFMFSLVNIFSQDKKDVELSRIEGGNYKLVNTVVNLVEYIAPFYISTYKITMGQYRDFALETSPNSIVFDEYYGFEEYGTKNIPNNFPIGLLNWYDMIKFCNWLSDKEGFEKAYTIESKEGVPTRSEGKVIWNREANGYRLPTEIEWEYAATCGGTDKAIISKNSTNLLSIAWCHENSDYEYHEVGLKLPNKWGLYDCLGSMYEMCWDSNEKDEKIVRGGDYLTSVQDLNIYNRFYSHPLEFHYPVRSFRVVRNISLLNIPAVLNDSNVRIREKPELDSSVLVKVNKDDKVLVIEQGKKEKIDTMEASWYKVVLENKTEGWVYGYYLDFEDELD